MNHFLLYWKNESDYRGDKKALEAYNLLKVYIDNPNLNPNLNRT